MLSFPLDPAAFAGFVGDLNEENSTHKNSGGKNPYAANSASENSDTAKAARENTSTVNSAGENQNAVNFASKNPNDENLKNENFDGENFAPVLLGSVVINLDLVELKAAQLGHGRDDETALLFTHGMLHVLGYDHESDDGQMRAKECEIIEKFRLPKSLIVRTEGSEE
ncbi:rRNA maturation RNase YbeY [uncultured Campylobacter sp.]|uniref:rRNA maturation RNase YbeY n=1 Tax=uncultured Campylobacter sp. TaxID=218934 RepID=UPI0026119791|nr:rRNA maturation RNase YbeY [uncultured Campylobacter sp.]